MISDVVNTSCHPNDKHNDNQSAGPRINGGSVQLSNKEDTTNNGKYYP